MGILARLGLVVPELSNPAAPGTGKRLLYPKADGRWYTKSPGSAEAVVGPGGVGARAYLTADMTLPNMQVTAVPLAGETYDSGAMHDTAVNNSRIVIPETGDYLVIAQAQHAAPSGQVQTRVHKNGVFWGLSVTVGSSAAENPQFVDVLSLAANDYLELAVYQASGAQQVVYGGSGATFLTVKRKW